MKSKDNTPQVDQRQRSDDQRGINLNLVRRERKFKVPPSELAHLYPMGIENKEEEEKQNKDLNPGPDLSNSK